MIMHYNNYSMSPKWLQNLGQRMLAVTCKNDRGYDDSTYADDEPFSINSLDAASKYLAHVSMIHTCTN